MCGGFVCNSRTWKLIKKLNWWKDGVHSKVWKWIWIKTKLRLMEKATREYTILEDGHVVCGRGVGGNSIQCTKCQKWVQKWRSSIQGSTVSVSKSFVCRGCTYQCASVDRTSMDIGDGASLELCVLLPGWHVEHRWWWWWCSCGG